MLVIAFFKFDQTWNNPIEKNWVEKNLEKNKSFAVHPFSKIQPYMKRVNFWYTHQHDRKKKKERKLKNII